MTDAEVDIAVLQERVDRIERATILQATEYERRLTELNHAHTRQVENQSLYVHRDVYEQFVREALEWRQHVREQLAERQGGIISMREMLFKGIPLIISVGTVIWLIIRKVL